MQTRINSARLRQREGLSVTCWFKRLGGVGRTEKGGAAAARLASGGDPLKFRLPEAEATMRCTQCTRTRSCTPMEYISIHLTNVHARAHAFHNKVLLLITHAIFFHSRNINTKTRHEAISHGVKSLSISSVHATYMSPSSISSTHRIRMYRFQKLIHYCS